MTEMNVDFYSGKLWKDGHFEDQKGGVKEALIWIFGTLTMWVGTGSESCLWGACLLAALNLRVFLLES
jgi:hypothetical protein